MNLTDVTEVFLTSDHTQKASFFTYHHIVDHGTSSNSYIPEGFYSHITGTIKHGRKVLLCHDGIKHDAVLIDAISHEGGSVQ